MTAVQTFSEKIINNIEKVIVGKRNPVELAIISLLCQGHLLIEDVPGVGKTVLARSLAKSLGCIFSRIQFTPDMLPRPFMVLATQNPIEYEGTFPLPEAQLDRFLVRLRLGYPEMNDEISILERQH